MADMPPPRKFEDDDAWHIGKPDLIVEIPQHACRARDGPDVWIDYIADSGLTGRSLRAGGRDEARARRATGRCITC